MPYKPDRYAFVLTNDTATIHDLDHPMMDILMQWWLRRQPRMLQWLAHQACWYCGAQPYEYEPSLGRDHVFPDLYTTTPLVPCCRRCNSRKGHRTPEAWRSGDFTPYWFETIGLAASPLGCVLREDFHGLCAQIFWYLHETSPRIYGSMAQVHALQEQHSRICSGADHGEM